jgi:hypothetical protein
MLACRPKKGVGRTGRTRPDKRPFLIRQTDPLAQDFLQKEALDQSPSFASTFVHEAQEMHHKSQIRLSRLMGIFVRF